MKFGYLLPALLATQASASAVPPTGLNPEEREILKALLENPQFFYPTSTFRLMQEQAKNVLSKRQTPPNAGPGKKFGLESIVGVLSTLEAMITSYKPLNPKAPPTTVPERVTLPTHADWPGSQRVKVRYGPYRIPPTSEKNWDSVINKVQGMGNTFKLGATKPCSGDCKVLSLSSSLEYANGENAENSNGAWYHHAVLLNYGPNAKTPNCGNVSLENLFMAGNEKSPVFFALPNSTVHSGYTIGPKDTFILDTQLMNLQDKEKWVWVTVTYDIVDKPMPTMKTGRNAWMSLSPWTAGVCPTSFVNRFGQSNLTSNSLPLKNVFGEHSLSWFAPADGFILATGGHMHDGGVNTEIFLNDKNICTSIAYYGAGAGEHSGHGAAPSGGAPSGMMGSANGAASNALIPHIQKQTRCEFKDGLPIKKGDEMYIVANYDFTQHPGMRNSKNELDSVMGIVGTLVAY